MIKLVDIVLCSCGNLLLQLFTGFGWYVVANVQIVTDGLPVILDNAVTNEGSILGHLVVYNIAGIYGKILINPGFNLIVHSCPLFLSLLFTQQGIFIASQHSLKLLEAKGMTGAL